MRWRTDGSASTPGQGARNRWIGGGLLLSAALRTWRPAARAAGAGDPPFPQAVINGFARGQFRAAQLSAAEVLDLCNRLVTVRFVCGAVIGHEEEAFIGRLQPGDGFHFAGHQLEFVRLREMTAQVTATTRSPSRVAQASLHGYKGGHAFFLGNLPV